MNSVSRLFRQFAGGAVALATPRDSSAAAIETFERRAAALRDQEDDRTRSRQSLAEILAEAGPMPADVAEECARGTLAALRAAHAARWHHGAPALDQFLLDDAGEISLVGIGVRQREAWLKRAGRERIAVFEEDSAACERLWTEAFLDGAVEDFRRLGPSVAAPLTAAIEGGRPAWATRLLERLDAVDGTIGTVDDVERAWRTIDGAFAMQALRE